MNGSAAVYKPRAVTVQVVKHMITDSDHILVLGQRNYVPILAGNIPPRFIARLIEEGFLRKAGRLDAVLKEHNSSWDEYREAKGNEESVWDRGVTTYEVLRDINEFTA